MKELEIGEVAKLIKLKPHTLRYYENIGLIKDIKRNNSGNRIYSEKDLRWIESLKRLKATGMKISKMKEYAELKDLGDTTISQRRTILKEHLNLIEDEIKVLLETEEYVKNKIEIYKEMEEEFNERRE